MPQYLTVQGRGNISAVPDQVVIQFELTQTHITYSKCLALINEKVEMFYFTAGKAGIESKQIKLSNFRVDAIYSWANENQTQRLLSGYTASYYLHLKMDFEPKIINRLFDTLVENSKYVEVKLSFNIKDSEPFEDQALEKALANAKSKAQLIARSTGVTLGKIEHINYGSVMIEFSEERESRMAMESSPTFLSEMEFTPQDLNISDNVAITWEIS